MIEQCTITLEEILIVQNSEIPQLNENSFVLRAPSIWNLLCFNGDLKLISLVVAWIWQRLDCRPTIKLVLNGSSVNSPASIYLIIYQAGLKIGLKMQPFHLYRASQKPGTDTGQTKYVCRYSLNTSALWYASMKAWTLGQRTERHACWRSLSEIYGFKKHHILLKVSCSWNWSPSLWVDALGLIISFLRW